MDLLISNVSKTRDKETRFLTAVKSFEKFVKKNISRKDIENLQFNVLILTAPCFGFGDVIFSIKLRKYIETWYKNSTVWTATTRPDLFKKVESLSRLITLELKNKSTASANASDALECRKFSSLKFKERIPNQIELVFVAPLISDFIINFSDVKRLIPSSSHWNTFFFTEYNDPTKKAAFPTGIGKGNLGIFLTDVPKASVSTVKKFELVPGEYAFSWLSHGNAIDGAERCMLSFMEMVIKRNVRKGLVFQLVVPPWVQKMFNDPKEFNTERQLVNFKKISSPYFKDVSIVVKNTGFISGGKKELLSFKGRERAPGNKLIVRTDIFPVSNDILVQIVKFSVKDVLTTGDQSLTDVLSCCPNKNIWYQVVPWKKNLADNLAKELPNSFIKKKSTSCGALKTFQTKQNPENIIRKYDFRKTGKDRMDGIVFAVVNSRADSILGKIKDSFLKSSNTKTLVKKLETI